MEFAVAVKVVGTVTVAEIAVPTQLFAVGVIVNVLATCAVVMFANVPLIVPDPLAAIPVAEAVLLFVQLNTVPLTLPLNVIGVMAVPEQTV